MKILHLVSTMNPIRGGVSSAVHNFIVASSRIDIIHEVICFDEPSENYITAQTYRVYALGKGKTPWNYHPDLLGWLTRNLHQFDFVVTHGLWQYQSYAIVHALKKIKTRIPKLFVMPHGMLDPYFQRAKDRKLKAVRNSILWHFVEKHLINQAEGLFFTCQQEQVLANETFNGYHPRNSYNIGLGIEPPPKFTVTPAPILDNKPYILFLSRIHPKKGVELLIDAYLLLKNEHLNLPDLVIAGPISDEYSLSMQQKAMGYSQIHFTGMLQGNLKWGAFLGCEAFILASHQENFGIAVVEALACKKPVLISDQVNIWQEIKNGQGGIVAPDTLEGVCELLRQFTKLNKDKKIQMGINAHKIYEEYFTINQAATKMLTILKEYN